MTLSLKPPPKLPSAEVWLRAADRTRRALERVHASPRPREVYRHVLSFGPIRAGAGDGEGPHDAALAQARLAAVLAQPGLILAAREAALELLLSRYPLASASRSAGTPAAGSPAAASPVAASLAARAAPPAEPRLCITEDALRFHLGWHDVLWTILAGLPVGARQLSPELSGLDPPGAARPPALPAAEPAPAGPMELGDLLYRHFLLDQAVPLFEALGAIPHLPERIAAPVGLLAGWIQASSLTRLAHLGTLGRHVLLKPDSWPGMADILAAPLLDAPGVIARALADLDEMNGEQLAPKWLEVVTEILRAVSAGGEARVQTTGEALWRLLVRSYGARDGGSLTSFEEICFKLVAAPGPERIRPILQLAKVLHRSAGTHERWTPVERDGLARLASAAENLKRPDSKR